MNTQDDLFMEQSKNNTSQDCLTSSCTFAGKYKKSIKSWLNWIVSDFSTIYYAESRSGTDIGHKINDLPAVTVRVFSSILTDFSPHIRPTSLCHPKCISQDVCAHERKKKETDI